MNKRTHMFGMVLALLFLSFAAMAQTVKMNEIYARGVAGNLDWIEIYNPTDAPIDISAYKIYDSGGNTGSKPKKPFPASTIIPAKGFYVIIVDTASFVGDASSFGLSSSGEMVWLQDSTTGTIIDTVTFGATATVAQSYGRGPDGGAWVVLNTITRGASNGAIVMNEIYSRGVAGNLDWVEIYNSVSATVNLSGYRIYDSGGNTGSKPKKALASNATIPANGFFVVITDTADFTGDPSSFGLSSTGEKVWLEDTTRSTVVDTITFGVMTVDQSWGRLTDGGVWGLLTTITRGATNGTPVGVWDDEAVAESFRLSQNYPNPFNPSTTIWFSVDREAAVRLTVYNLLGQPVATLADQRFTAGAHSVSFEARNLPSGVYVYRLEVGSKMLTRTMMLMK